VVVTVRIWSACLLNSPTTLRSCDSGREVTCPDLVYDSDLLDLLRAAIRRDSRPDGETAAGFTRGRFGT
jgi:hypothetical protein